VIRVSEHYLEFSWHFDFVHQLLVFSRDPKLARESKDPNLPDRLKIPGGLKTE